MCFMHNLYIILPYKERQSTRFKNNPVIQSHNINAEKNSQEATKAAVNILDYF